MAVPVPRGCGEPACAQEGGDPGGRCTQQTRSPRWKGGAPSKTGCSFLHAVTGMSLVNKRPAFRLLHKTKTGRTRTLTSQRGRVRRGPSLTCQSRPRRTRQTVLHPSRPCAGVTSSRRPPGTPVTQQGPAHPLGRQRPACPRGICDLFAARPSFPLAVLDAAHSGAQEDANPVSLCPASA